MLPGVQKSFFQRYRPVVAVWLAQDHGLWPKRPQLAEERFSGALIRRQLAHMVQRKGRVHDQRAWSLGDDAPIIVVQAFGELRDRAKGERYAKLLRRALQILLSLCQVGGAGFDGYDCKMLWAAPSRCELVQQRYLLPAGADTKVALSIALSSHTHGYAAGPDSLSAMVLMGHAPRRLPVPLTLAIARSGDVRRRR
jgi:hypothetical protein